eukprot:CAMPEP_0183743928 /NCGR_PEP_ID=MMETSP0737-20130205/65466_1 /TAXON_ID=385413 /ORGANISM="Thalassiosira miniscula, Strain CCMP1093" /LENGTH=565 /DNA_ID=CAMNT_0025979561 /DNA_START=86 /DNA_END=1786 /DNA_ORIENTATION=+
MRKGKIEQAKKLASNAKVTGDGGWLKKSMIKKADSDPTSFEKSSAIATIERGTSDVGEGKGKMYKFQFAKKVENKFGPNMTSGLAKKAAKVSTTKGNQKDVEGGRMGGSSIKQNNLKHRRTQSAEELKKKQERNERMERMMKKIEDSKLEQSNALRSESCIDPTPINKSSAEAHFKRGKSDVGEGRGGKERIAKKVDSKLKHSISLPAEWEKKDERDEKIGQSNVHSSEGSIMVGKAKEDAAGRENSKRHQSHATTEGKLNEKVAHRASPNTIDPDSGKYVKRDISNKTRPTTEQHVARAKVGLESELKDQAEPGSEALVDIAKDKKTSRDDSSSESKRERRKMAKTWSKTRLNDQVGSKGRTKVAPKRRSNDQKPKTRLVKEKSDRALRRDNEKGNSKKRAAEKKETKLHPSKNDREDDEIQFTKLGSNQLDEDREISTLFGEAKTAKYKESRPDFMGIQKDMSAEKNESTAGTAEPASATALWEKKKMSKSRGAAKVKPSKEKKKKSRREVFVYVDKDETQPSAIQACFEYIRVRSCCAGAERSYLYDEDSYFDLPDAHIAEC